jgi:hypothetical protein
VIPIKCPTSQPEKHLIKISERYLYSRSVSNVHSTPYSPNFVVPDKIFSPGSLEIIEETPLLEYSEVLPQGKGYQIPLGKIQSEENHFAKFERQDSVWGSKNYDLDLAQPPVSLKDRFKGKDWSA